MNSVGEAQSVPEISTDDVELLEIVRSHSRESEQRQAACQVLVSRYQWLVRACVQPYRGGPEHEDLMQVGYLGLLKAINYFDPEVGSSLAAYARPCIAGEIKRHFRDKRWQVHVKRSVQELRLGMRSATTELTQCLQRKPLDTEIADFMQVSVKDVEEARLADTAYFPVSIDAMRPSGSDGSAADLTDFLGAEDPQLEHLLGMESVSAHWPGLPADQQRVLLLIFYGNMTQEDVGKRLGVSQMQVSRLRARALEYLRTAILDTNADEAREPERLSP
jgi:RNA polymerase sigma-B factor